MALDSNGFTILEPSIDSRLVYVSSSEGNNNNDGLSPQTPKATIGAGLTLLRNNYPDWLLLKGGDIFEGSQINLSNRSGRTAEEPLTITSYGTGRPMIRNGSIYTTGGSGRKTYFLSIVGLEFYQSQIDPESNDYDPQATLLTCTIHTMGSDVLIEDCVFRFIMLSLEGVDGRIERVSLRRNLLLDAYKIGTHSAGAFFSRLDDLLLEDNYIDHNGWNATASGASASTLSHNIYIRAFSIHTYRISTMLETVGSVTGSDLVEHRLHGRPQCFSSSTGERT